MVIVAGKLTIQPNQRETFLAASEAAMMQARQTAGCQDFVVAADPLEPDRVNVFELWDLEGALRAFRGAGPGDELGSLIQKAEVKQYRSKEVL